MEFNHTCRKCKHLKLTYEKYNKEWTCVKRNKNKSFDQTIFNNLCRDFESKVILCTDGTMKKSKDIMKEF